VVARGGTLTADSGVKLSLSGSGIWDGGEIAGAGTTTLTKGSGLTVLGATLAGKFVNDGAIDWQSGLVCLENPAVLTNSGSFTMAADSEEISACNGTVSLQNTAAGAITVAASPGDMDVDSSFTFTTTAHTAATFALPCPALLITDKTAVKGSLAIHTRKGVKPKLGESCAIISDAGGLTGKFKKVTGTKAGKGLVYAVGYTPTSVTLTVKS
jgi:hypothetical protein